MNETENRFREFEEFDGFSDINKDKLILEYLRKPKIVYKYLFKTNPQIHFWTIMVVVGAIGGLESGLEKFYIYDKGVFYLLGAAIAGGGLSWIVYFINAWIYKFFASAFLNGTSSVKNYRVVVAWSNIPTAGTIIFTLIIYLLYDYQISETTSMDNQIYSFLISTITILSFGLTIWSLVLTVLGIMHIQQFSIGKAILNVLIPMVIIIGVVAIFVYSTIGTLDFI